MPNMINRIPAAIQIISVDISGFSIMKTPAAENNADTRAHPTASNAT